MSINHDSYIQGLSDGRKAAERDRTLKAVELYREGFTRGYVAGYRGALADDSARRTGLTDHLELPEAS